MSAPHRFGGALALPGCAPTSAASDRAPDAVERVGSVLAGSTTNTTVGEPDREKSRQGGGKFASFMFSSGAGDDIEQLAHKGVWTRHTSIVKGWGVLENCAQPCSSCLAECNAVTCHVMPIQACRYKQPSSSAKLKLF